MKKIVEIAHDLLVNSTYQKAVDFTCGQGFDTLFLCQHYPSVIGFDIQAEAINQTRELLAKNHLKATLHQCSHADIEDKFTDFDCGIYNLGYLPHGDPTITTSGESVIQSLEVVLPRLNSGGRIVIVCYPGFEAGANEAIMLESFVSKLSAKQYAVSSFKLLNRTLCPYIIILDKTN